MNDSEPAGQTEAKAPAVEDGALYLVTGGAGFIGSHLSEALLRGGARVRVLDDFSSGREENIAHLTADIDLVRGTVTDEGTCRAVCEGVHYVLHQAARPSVARSMAEPLSTHAADATGTLNMLVAARDQGVKRFVYAGSSSAYGDTEVLPKTESLPTRPRSPYAVAKLTGELYCQVFAQTMDLETVVLRYFNIFGPRQDPNSQYSAVIPLFITLALEGRSPTVNGDGEQTRDFTYVENAVAANLLACHRPAEAVSGKVFNVGCGERISVNELWREVRRITGASVDVVHGPPRPGDVRDSLADLTLGRSLLGYHPRVALADGLRRTCDWFRG